MNLLLLTLIFSFFFYLSCFTSFTTSTSITSCFTSFTSSPFTSSTFTSSTTSSFTSSATSRLTSPVWPTVVVDRAHGAVRSPHADVHGHHYGGQQGTGNYAELRQRR